MLSSQQFWFLKRVTQKRLLWLRPLIAGGIMLFATIVPWMNDPLTGIRSAWQLPVDIGWQVHSPLLSYGLLCFLCALCSLVVAYANWKPFRGSSYFVRKHIQVGLLCCIPLFLFLLQYLLADTVSIDVLSQHEIQLQLIQHHFGYDYPAQLVYIDPFSFDTSTLLERLRLFIVVASGGMFLPCLSAWLLLDYRRFAGELPFSSRLRGYYASYRRVFWVALSLIGLLLLGRAPAALLCEYQAKAALSTGNYIKALNWLDSAEYFNPALTQVYYYHVERGEALYFLNPQQETNDSSAFIAFSYNQRGDHLDAYQQLLGLWRAHGTTPWIVNEMSYSLEGLSEFSRPLKGITTRRSINDDSALPWLQILLQVDPMNTYGRYVEGRIQCDLHNYDDCTRQMSTLIEDTINTNVRSSAYTYMALGYGGEGNFLAERTLLLEAVKLDPNYLNNTAREELSGLR